MKHAFTAPAAPTALAALTALAILTILSVPLLGRAQDDDDAVNLRLRLQAGDKYQLTMTTEETMTEWFGNNEAISTSTAIRWVTMDVISVEEDGSAKVKLTFDRIAIKTKAGDDDASEYDSQNPGENLEYPLTLHQSVIGQSFQAKLSPAGEVIEVLEADALQGAQTKAHSRGRSRVIRSTSRRGFAVAVFGTDLGLDPKTLMAKKGLRRLASSILFLRPDQPVATGHAWARENDLPIDPPMKCDSTYTLASHENGAATIQIEGTIKDDPRAHARMAKTIFPRWTSSMEGTRSGELKLDKESGVVTLARIVDTLKGEIKPTDEPDEENDEGTHTNLRSVLTTLDIVTTITCEKQP